MMKKLIETKLWALYHMTRASLSNSQFCVMVQRTSMPKVFVVLSLIKMRNEKGKVIHRTFVCMEDAQSFSHKKAIG